MNYYVQANASLFPSCRVYDSLLRQWSHLQLEEVSRINYLNQNNPSSIFSEAKFKLDNPQVCTEACPLGTKLAITISHHMIWEVLLYIYAAFID